MSVAVTVGAKPRISVVVPAHNAAATLGATLAGLAGQELSVPYEVIVVDDGSTDATAAVAAVAPPPVRLVRQDSAGAAAARNAGAAAASADLLAFVDADCVPDRAWLGAGLHALRDADLVQGLVLPDPAARLGPFDRSLWVRSATPLFETANLFVTRDAFRAAGGFEAVVAADGRPLGEDVVFGWRALRTGARSGFGAGALVHHAVFGRGPRAYVAEYRRLSAFPTIVRHAPELRDAMLFRRVFLSRRRAAFTFGLGGAAAATWCRSATPLVAVVPYAIELARHVRPWGRRAPLLGAVQLVADGVATPVLVGASVRDRVLVL